ncbi:hypothetical protein B296_00036000 [Ensete ventricosum]|uniref:Uncharacterized protein n=1 Tax=Ensete ventricosum TaxID=4639 RepID=A0A426YR51_ENSVE|nr:hypothetical protein B296_00036000 [Ensete ventricosum]
MPWPRHKPSNLNERPGEDTPITHHASVLEGQLPFLPSAEGDPSAPTPSRYCRLFDDPRFSPPGFNAGHRIVSIEPQMELYGSFDPNCRDGCRGSKKAALIPDDRTPNGAL